VTSPLRRPAALLALAGHRPARSKTAHPAAPLPAPAGSVTPPPWVLAGHNPPGAKIGRGRAL